MYDDQQNNPLDQTSDEWPPTPYDRAAFGNVEDEAQPRIAAWNPDQRSMAWVTLFIETFVIAFPPHLIPNNRGFDVAYFDYHQALSVWLVFIESMLVLWFGYYVIRLLQK